jgi:hypothetical protein
MSEVKASDIVIQKRFKDLLDEQSADERKNLEAVLLSDGCRDALVVWCHNGKYILLDGHNRFEICKKHGISFETHVMEFGSVDAAEEWVDMNQISRRNCAPEQFRLIVGRIYNRRKKTKGAPAGNANAKQKDQVDPFVSDSTAQEVSAELGVSAPTVKRAGKRAAAHDVLAKAGNKGAAVAIAKAPQSVVDKTAKVLHDTTKPEPERIKEAVAIATSSKVKDKPEATDQDRRKENKDLVNKHIEAAIRAITNLNSIAPNARLCKESKDALHKAYDALKLWKV